MNKSRRLEILNQRLGKGDCYEFSLSNYKELLRKHGYEDTLTNSSLYLDLKDALEGYGWVKNRLKFLALQNGNINVAMGATNRLLEIAESQDVALAPRVARKIIKDS